MIIVVLVLLGLSFGSFVNALVWRLRQQSLSSEQRERGARKAKKAELSISKGRSMCVHCGHTLKAIDLLPVVSWLSLGGKCRYCHRKVSWQYPLVELSTAGLFVSTYLLWPNYVAGWEIVAFGLWLVSLTGFMALIVYDLRWMLLPNRIVFPLYGVAALFVLSRMAAEMSIAPLLSSLIGVLIGGGLFYLLFQVSQGRWIGGGDVKLGFLLGAIVGGPVQAVLVLFGASLLGTLITVPLMLSGRAGRHTRIPFGPFLIAAAIFTQLFGVALTDWYSASFLDI